MATSTSLARFLGAISGQPVMNQFNALSTQQKRDIAAHIADVPKARPDLVDSSVGSANVESAPMTITFSDAVTATASLTLDAVGLSGNNPTDFLIKTAGTSCGNSMVLVVCASCTVSVSFRPATAAGKTTLLNFPYTQSTIVTRTAQLNGVVSMAPPPPSASAGGGAMAALWALFAAAAVRRRMECRE